MTTAVPEAGAVMTFREHLKELRDRLVRVVIVFIIGFLVCWEFRVELFDFLSRPITTALADNNIFTLQAIQITESVMVYLKTAFIGTLFFLSPFIFWQLWGFIGPGLYRHEKQFVVPLTAFSVVFFVIGSAFSYTILLPFISDWLINMSFDATNVEVLVTQQNAYSFAFTFLLMFGLVFELPLVIFFMALWGQVTGKRLLKFWRYFVVISVLVSAVLTPPDPLSQILMAVPLNILYGFGILVAMAVSRARKRNAEHVGGAALKLMALLLAGVIAFGLAVALVISSLPDRSLLGMVPERASWTIGANPKAALSQASVRALLVDVAAFSEVRGALSAEEIDLSEVSEALAFGDGDERAIAFRDSGLGAHAAAIRERLSAGHGPALLATDLVAAQTDDDTLVVGHRNMVAAALAVVFAEAPGHPRNVDDERLLKRLALSGPVWAWVPTPSEHGAAFLGDTLVDDVGNAGASLVLGADVKLGLYVRAKDEDSMATLDGELQAARNNALAVESGARLRVLFELLDALTEEVEAMAAGGQRARLNAIRTRLAPLKATHDPVRVAILATVAPYARGWSVKQNKTWFTLTTELDERGLPALVDAVAR